MTENFHTFPQSSPPFSTKVKQAWCYTSLPSVFTAHAGTTLPLPYFSSSFSQSDRLSQPVEQHAAARYVYWYTFSLLFIM
jgi:hypothetical protein